MRGKRIAITGVTLIASVVGLAIIMYYFNQDKCPVGTFLCENSTICMPQRSWCNGHNDCPQADDESYTHCFDDSGNWEWFLKQRPETPPFTCDCPTTRGCQCNKCRVTCEGLSAIPQDLSPNVTSVNLSHNNFNGVHADALQRYTEIRSLYLISNGIEYLKEGAFSELSSLYWLFLTNNSIKEIRPGHFRGLSSLETLVADGNSINKADFSDFAGSRSLELINLRNNSLTEKTLKFPELPALRELQLDYNKIRVISGEFLAGMPSLRSLTMEGNGLITIDPNAFRNLRGLTELNLADNEISLIPDHLLKPLVNLTQLMIGYNPIKNLQISIFDGLINLRSLGLEEVDMENSGKHALLPFKNLEFVYFKKFHYCNTYAPNVQNCRPASDGVSSLSHLLGKPLLKVAVWGISSVTCLGNALVLWGRFTAKDENRVLSIVIRNLAVSDMLMGIYLFIIGLVDVQFRDTYNQQASAWMSSWGCTLLGILAMTSSEVSVLILSFMSIERFILIAAPLKGQQRSLTPQTAGFSMIFIWMSGIVLALIPAIHWRSSTRFYGLNGMCFPLHIDDPFLIGWEYSAFIFLGVNLVGLVTIGYVYAGMFASIWRTRHNTPLFVGDSEFALRFFFIVLTDAACWAPIIALKILAFLKYPVPPDLHAWVVIFVLPVNSAINPLLYTFTTPKFRERLEEGWVGQLRNYVLRRTSAQDSQGSLEGTQERSNSFLSLTTKWTGFDKKFPNYKKH
ncbi:relaxin receptor 1 [Diachasma alloeum]|uniref:relaxin receptor 1 n=1 Tax=Diachasma alloeum TaxID=454923 RepID=UPI0007381AAA|nr:relaxin receptor 1 [Diachasma alloeum]